VPRVAVLPRRRGGGGASGSASSATLDTYRFAPEDIHMSASVEAEFLAE